MSKVSNKNHISRMEELASSLRRANRLIQVSVLREMCELVTQVDAEGVKSVSLLLEHVTATGNFEICVKLLSVVGHAAVSSLAHYERVATCEGVYSAAARVLGKGLPNATVAALRCLTALCAGGGGGGEGRGGDDARGASVGRSARGHVRDSGCLHAMVELFYRKNMYAETWRELCRCLVESCRDCEPNQTICSRLVPTCVERAAAAVGGSGGGGGGGIGATLPLLLALVEGHAANRESFLNCGGLRLFTREMLVHESGAILLSAAVEGHALAARSAFSAGVPNTLAHLITAHGADSQVGEWCSIGLFHITSGLKMLAKSNNHLPCDQNNTDLCNTVISPTINRQQRDPEVMTQTLNQKCDQNGRQTEIQCQGNLMKHSLKQSSTNQVNSTFECRMNIDKNVLTTSTTIDNMDLELGKRIELLTNALPVQHFEDIPYRTEEVRTDLYDTLQCERILKPHQIIKLKQTCSVSNSSQAIIRSLPGEIHSLDVQSRGDKSCQTSFEETKCQTSGTTNVQASYAIYDSSVSEFKPLAVSTPRLSNKAIHFDNWKRHHYKGNRQATKRKHSHRTSQSVIESSGNYFIPQTSQHNKNRYTGKIYPDSEVIKNCAPVNKQAKITLGSKLFNSINASCASIAQSFKKFVLPEKKEDTDTKHVSRTIRRRHKNTERPHTDTSFTEYMRNRAHIAPKTIKPADYREIDFSGFGEIWAVGGGRRGVGCITCDNTSLLQQKLASNECLKETVKKLKLGINTYGCNFKKISNAFWPNEPFMTSAVLYNLYRKLIVKKTNK